MKRILQLAFTLLMVSILSISFVTPALACEYDTVLELSASSTEVSSGDNVTLTILDTYNGDTPLESPYVKLYINTTVPGNLIATLDRTTGYVSGDTGIYDQMDEDGETWQWQHTVTVGSDDVTFIAIGYATNFEDELFTSPTERDEVTITVEDNGGGEGLTPGFWKNHHGAWAPTGYSPSDDFDFVFGTDWFDPDIDLDAALRLKGGKCKALVRHAVAALLNAAHPDVSYEFTVAEVIDMVQNATDCEAVKDILEEQNELGGEI